MKKATPSGFFSATVAGLLALGGLAGGARGQNPPAPNEPPPGSAADRAEDKQEARALREKIRQDREKLQLDTQQFGKNSPQARADRRQLRADRRALKRLRHDMRRDRHISERRRAWRLEHRAHLRGL